MVETKYTVSSGFSSTFLFSNAHPIRGVSIWQEAIRFVAWAGGLLDTLPKSLAAYDQLDRASTSIALNMAEGNGKYTPPDRCRFFDIARGSALECAACLDVLVAKKKLACAEQGKEMLVPVVSMRVGLIRSTSSDRVHEERVEYEAGNRQLAD